MQILMLLQVDHVMGKLILVHELANPMITWR